MARDATQRAQDRALIVAEIKKDAPAEAHKIIDAFAREVFELFDSLRALAQQKS